MRLFSYRTNYENSINYLYRTAVRDSPLLCTRSIHRTPWERRNNVADNCINSHYAIKPPARKIGYVHHCNTSLTFRGCNMIFFSASIIHRLYSICLIPKLMVTLPLVFQNLFRFTFGSHHPAAPGVLCCLLHFIGGFILFIDVNIGYLHRGTEELGEFKTMEQIVPYMDLIDYGSVVAKAQLASLTRIYSPLPSICRSRVRVLRAELTRCFNSLLCISVW